MVKRRTAPSPSGRPSPGSSSRKDPIGDHSGQVDPSASNAKTAAGSAADVTVCSITCSAMLLRLLRPPIVCPPGRCLLPVDCTIWYMPRQSARERLLDAVIEHFATEGLGDQSLRHMADAVGSSHRMLLYHFGSRDGLLLAVAQEVEARTQGELASRCSVPAGPPTTMIRHVWAYVADPDLGPFERLFFALYGRALQGEASLRPLLEGDVVALARPQRGRGPRGRHRRCPEAIRVHARLGLAVVRGLLLDLLATGERDEVDAALEVFATRYAGAGADGGLADGRESVAGVSARASKGPGGPGRP